MKKEDVIIQETKEGLLISINLEQNVTDLKLALKKKLESTELNYADDINVIIDIGYGILSPKEKKEFARLVRKYSEGKLKKISWWQSKSKGTVISIDTREEIELLDADDKKGHNSPNPEIGQEQPEVTESISVIETVQSRKTDQVGEDNTILIKRTMRSGQSVHFDGNVIILGDVNPGAEVIASGNIVVMGSFRGIAHAGAMGNENAIVTAFRLQPTQLRIANHITRAPDGDYTPPEQPEIAHIKDGVVMIEAYHTSQDRQKKIG